MSDYITLELADTMKKYEIPENAWEEAAETVQVAEEFVYAITFGTLSL